MKTPDAITADGRPRRIVLAMSGGVDSSASALLLKRQGYEVIGLFMRSGATEETVCASGGDRAAGVAAGGVGGASENLLPIFPPISPAASRSAGPAAVPSASHKQGCCSAADAADARRVADLLDIPFYALDFKEAFGRIKDYFADEYLAGRTPNPCVRCNNWLKFGKLWE